MATKPRGVRLPEDTWEALDAVAKERGVTTNDVLRERVDGAPAAVPPVPDWREGEKATVPLRLLKLPENARALLAVGIIDETAAKNHLLPFVDLPEALRRGLFAAIAGEVCVVNADSETSGPLPGKRVKEIVAHFAAARSAPLQPQTGAATDPVPLFTVEQHDAECGCGAPRFAYGSFGLPHRRCFNLSWYEAKNAEIREAERRKAVGAVDRVSGETAETYYYRMLDKCACADGGEGRGCRFCESAYAVVEAEGIRGTLLPVDSGQDCDLCAAPLPLAPAIREPGADGESEEVKPDEAPGTADKPATGSQTAAPLPAATSAPVGDDPAGVRGEASRELQERARSEARDELLALAAGMDAAAATRGLLAGLGLVSPLWLPELAAALGLHREGPSFDPASLSRDETKLLAAVAARLITSGTHERVWSLPREIADRAKAAAQPLTVGAGVEEGAAAEVQLAAALASARRGAGTTGDPIAENLPERLAQLRSATEGAARHLAAGGAVPVGLDLAGLVEDARLFLKEHPGVPQAVGPRDRLDSRLGSLRLSLKNAREIQAAAAVSRDPEDVRDLVEAAAGLDHLSALCWADIQEGAPLPAIGPEVALLDEVEAFVAAARTQPVAPKGGDSAAGARLRAFTSNVRAALEAVETPGLSEEDDAHARRVLRRHCREASEFIAANEGVDASDLVDMLARADAVLTEVSA